MNTSRKYRRVKRAHERLKQSISQLVDEVLNDLRDDLNSGSEFENETGPHLGRIQWDRSSVQSDSEVECEPAQSVASLAGSLNYVAVLTNNNPQLSAPFFFDFQGDQKIKWKAESDNSSSKPSRTFDIATQGEKIFNNQIKKPRGNNTPAIEHHQRPNEQTNSDQREEVDKTGDRQRSSFNHDSHYSNTNKFRIIRFDDPEIRCPISECKKSFLHCEMFVQHFQQKHPNVNSHKCIRCDLNLDDTEQMFKHYLHYHQRGIFQCRRCNFFGHRRNEMFQHYHNKHELSCNPPRNAKRNWSSRGRQQNRNVACRYFEPPRPTDQPESSPLVVNGNQSGSTGEIIHKNGTPHQEELDLILLSANGHFKPVINNAVATDDLSKSSSSPSPPSLASSDSNPPLVICPPPLNDSTQSPPEGFFNYKNGSDSSSGCSGDSGPAIESIGAQIQVVSLEPIETSTCKRAIRSDSLEDGEINDEKHNGDHQSSSTKSASVNNVAELQPNSLQFNSIISQKTSRGHHTTIRKYIQESGDFHVIQCPVSRCRKTFRKRPFMVHFETTHRKSDALKCPKCSHVSHNAKAVYDHAYYQHQKGLFRCASDHCRYVNDIRTHVMDHYNRAHLGLGCNNDGSRQQSVGQQVATVV